MRYTVEEINALTLETYPYQGDLSDSQAVKDAWLALEKAKMLEELAEMTEQERVHAEFLEKVNRRRERVEAMILVDGGLPWGDKTPVELFGMIESEEIDPILDQLELSMGVWRAQKTSKAQDENLFKIGEIVEHRCKRALAYVAGFNVLGEKTVEQIDQMETDFSDILKALKNNRPDKASTLISGVNLAEYATLKGKLLSILSGE